MNDTFVLTATALAALAVAAPYASRRLQLSLAKHPSLTGHARMARRVAAWVPGYAYDEAGFFGSDGAPADVQSAPARGAAAPARRLRAAASRARCRPPTPRARPSPTCSSPAPTGCRSSTRATCASICACRRFVREAAGVTVTDLDGNVFYDLTGSYGVNVFGVDFYKACIADGHARVQALGPVLGSYHPCVADNVQRLRRISGMDEVSFHMSGTEAVMQAVRLARYHTRPQAAGAFCRRLPRLVGRRAARPRQSAAAARDLHAARDGRAHAARAALAPRHRLRAGQSAAGAASERGRAGRLDAARRQPPRALRPRRLHALAARAAHGVQRARHRADLRRGVRRLPAGSRRRAAVLRRAGRPGDLRQDGGRRPADRRGVRALALDEALSRRPPGRHLLRARHVQLAPVRDGRDAGLPRALRQRADPGAVPRPRRHLERARRVVQPAHAAPKGCRCARPTCRASGPSATTCRRATTGCCSSTCARTAWR